MTERRLYEGKPWIAAFERTSPTGDGYHTVLVMADTLQDAILALGNHLPRTDCKLTGIKRMDEVRGVIV